MRKFRLAVFISLCVVLVSGAPAAAQGFHRIGHVNKSHTKKAEHSDKNVKHASPHKTKKRKPVNDEGYRHRELKRQEKLRGENAGRPQEAPKPEAAEPEKNIP